MPPPTDTPFKDLTACRPSANGAVSNTGPVFCNGPAAGNTGAAGDYLSHLVVTPSSTSPGTITLQDDGSGASYTLFQGGASSLADLKPFHIVWAGKSTVGGWKLTVGAGLSVVPIGLFN